MVESPAILAFLVSVAAGALQDSQEQRLKALEETARKQQNRIDELEKSKPPPAAATQADTEFRAFWDKGINFQTADGAFALSIGGRIHNDWAWIDEDSGIRAEFGATGDQEDGTEFRRARLEFEGVVYERFLFELALDFSDGGVAEFKDAWLGIQDLPVVGRLTIGYQKIPFGLESLTSSNATTFMERGLGTEYLERRNTGLRAQNSWLEDRITASAGVFHNADDVGLATGEGEYNAVGRLTGLPWFGDKNHLFHVGLSVAQLSPTDDSLRFRERPEVHMAIRLVDTAVAPLAGVCDSALAWRAESALVFGPFSLQGEYTRVSVETESGVVRSDPEYDAYYVYASLFITGESRKFKPETAVFSSIAPKADFLKEGGLGAWELAFRYSAADLSALTADPQRQEVVDITIGVNWYWNQNMYVMFNYVHADLDEVGALEAFMMRFAIFF